MEEKRETPIELKINCTTWLKDTEDLFDFETTNISKTTYIETNLDKDIFILKYKDESDNKQKEKITFINNNLIKQKIHANDTTKIVGVLKFNKLKTNLKIINSFKSRLSENLYLPEKCERLYELFPLEQYVNIEEGDLIKIGRIRMKFDRISFKSKDKTLYEIINKDILNNSQTINSKDNYETVSMNKMLSSPLVNQSSARNTELNIGNQKPNCRLCYQSESSITDPLISPCNCSGSMKYIHLSCLKNSIKLKYHKKSEEYYDIFLFQNYNCEICLSMYPKYIIYKTQIYYLIDIDFNKFENYVLCDLTQYVDNNQKITHFGYLMFKIEDNMELSLGRKKNNHIKLKDISVSRNHCIIMKKDNNLLIKDLRSKFGTMRYINNYLEIDLQKNESKLLSGKHVLEFILAKSWPMFKFSNIFKFSCCTCNQPINEVSELIIYGEEKENLDKEYKTNNDDFKNKAKMKYYNKFKDCDSYNDYIIKIDNIIGLDNSELDLKDKQENENENSNNQIKDKEESFTNYY